MEEQTESREHTELFLCLKKGGHSDTGSNLDKLENAKWSNQATHKKEKKYCMVLRPGGGF